MRDAQTKNLATPTDPAQTKNQHLFLLKYFLIGFLVKTGNEHAARPKRRRTQVARGTDDKTKRLILRPLAAIERNVDRFFSPRSPNLGYLF
ncbi:MAG: hypothetical protein HN435_08655 [Nitrospinaceae bacterium]|jgi:hypothetical protein|nr:hypothetical protein [Nitrospinaceae bacterium]